ncbi:MAG: PspC domain-containing protein [Sphingobacteriia bacterium]|nr:PspC domain-containing protein [Sphingobacteriia bacterium]
MKKVININFQGRVVPIEESAYDVLKKYVDSLRNFFANEEGRDEIINDIESRIGELFAETLKKGSTCVTDDDVNRIIASMGRPEDFESEESNVKSQLSGEEQSAHAENTTAPASNEPRRLYRDENNKILGGVCSGLANYMNIDSVILRILFVIFIGITFVPYLILWVAIPSSATKVIGSPRKRLFRDAEDKIIAGVCSGLAKYFGISVWLPRILFLLPFISLAFKFGRWGWWNFPHFLSFSFSPGSLFVYIILWLIVPEAKSASDKLEMKGEKVDLNNIKNTIQSDLEGFGKRAEQFSKEMGTTLTEKGKQFSAEASTVAKRSGRSLGDIIVLIFKIFAYFILGVIVFSVVVSLFAIGVASTGVLPAWQYVFNDGWENILAWGTLVLFIWVPVLGIITFIFRRIAKIRSNSNIIRYSFLGLWLLGLFCFISLLTSLRNDFRYSNHPEEINVPLKNSRINKLELTIPPHAKYLSKRSWLKFEPFAAIDDDTIYVQNIRIHIVKSNTDTFKIGMLKTANGRSRAEADETVSKINYNITQIDSLLEFDKGIALSPTQKFRNQHISFTVYVPVGKKIRISDDIGWDNNVHVGFNWDDDDWDWRFYSDVKRESWRPNIEYLMTEKGLQRVDKYADDDNGNSADLDNTINELKQKKEELQKQKEQKLKELENIDKELNQKADTTKYRYQPDAPKKSSTPKTVSTAYIREATFNMHNIIMARVF